MNRSPWRFRLTTWTWPFAFGVGLGWLTVRTPNPDCLSARGRVYCLRGQGILFSSGLGWLCETLRQENIWAEDLRCMGDRWVVRQLRQDLEQDALRGPLILVGHSAGGRAALFAAQQLENWKLTVDLVVCIDVAYPPPVPGNVKRAVNVYRGQGRIYPAGPLVPAPGSRCDIHNLDLDCPTSPIKERGLNHLNITSNPGVQRVLLQHIRENVSQSLGGCL